MIDREMKKMNLKIKGLNEIKKGERERGNLLE